MKKTLVSIFCLLALNVWSVENLLVNGVQHTRWDNRSIPVILTGEMSSPAAKLRINVYQDANWDGRVNGGESLLRSFAVVGNLGPIGDGRLFPGNTTMDGTHFTIPIYPLDGTSYGSLALAVEVVDQDGSRATTKVTVPAQDPNIYGQVLDSTTDTPQLGISVWGYWCDSQTGETISRNSITDTGGNFHFDMPPGDYKLHAYPFVNSLVQKVSNVPLHVPQQGTVTPTIEMPPNTLFINGRLSGPPDLKNLLVTAQGNNNMAYAQIQPEGQFTLGVSNPGSYNVYFSPLGGNKNVWSQTFTPVPQKMTVEVNETTSPAHATFESEFNNANVTGDIQVMLDDMPLSSSFGYLNVNGFFQIEGYVFDPQYNIELDFYGKTDSIIPNGLGKSQHPVYARVAADASSPYLDGNSYEIQLHAGQVSLFGVPPFGTMLTENLNFDAIAGEVTQGPTLTWKITSDQVLTIEGIVRYPDGTPAEGATVAARTLGNWNDRSSEGMCPTDAEGRYKLAYLRKFMDQGESLRELHTYYIGVYVPGGYTADIQEVLGETSGVHTVNFDLSEPSHVANTPTLPRVCELKQNYPNPFNPATTVPYSINKRSHVSLKVFDVDGRLVTTLVDGIHAPGTYAVSWDASNSASGIYLLVMKTENVTRIRKSTLVK